MKKKSIILCCYVVSMIFLLTSCNSNKDTNPRWQPKDGYISNEASAIKVAETVWLNVYGSEINDEKPFVAKLKDDKIWIVEGTFNGGKYAKGGSAYIEIQKSDGKILKVIHGK